jgi:hypothetical protein
VPPSAISSIGETTFCELTGDDQPADTCAKFALQRDRNFSGRYGFNPKSPMTEGKEETVIFTIAAPSKNKEIEESVSDQDRKSSFGKINIGAYNYATLSGDATFKIERLTEEVRLISQEPIIIWRWKVTPRAKGKHKLTLNAGVELRVPGQEPQRFGADAISKTIEVKVVPGGQLDDFWAFLKRLFDGPVGALGALTALIGAIGAVWFAIKKLTRNGEVSAGNDISKPG